MKKFLVYVTCFLLFLCSGCSSPTVINNSWNYKTQSLLEFDYGCTIEEAESFFGLTKQDRHQVEEQLDSITYVYEIADWDIGAQRLWITIGTGTVNDDSYILGVNSIQFVSEGTDSEQMSKFYQAQVDCCDNKFSLGEEHYGYGDWAEYKDSAFVVYYTALEPVDIVPNLRGSEFDAKTWNDEMPLVECYRYNLGESLDLSEDIDFSNQNRIVFRGIAKAYVRADAYFEAKTKSEQ